MALSQKHPGKFIAPWYSVEECKYVYSLLYCEDNDKSKKEEALQILQIWKIRMPKLFAGIEGTLIILKALLIDENSFTKEDLRLQYGLAIMRFLNICAAYGDQQGTFFQVAKSNNLPEWLVQLRHDLAHSQKESSLFMLKKGLCFCLDWLKENYWKILNAEVKSVVISNTNTDLEDVKSKLITYSEFVWHKITKEKLSPITEKNLKNAKITRKTSAADVLYKIFGNVKPERISQIPDLLIEIGGMFNVPFEEDLTEIPTTYLQEWTPLLHYLYKKKLLLSLIQRLHYACNEDYIDNRIRIIYSLWLNKIFENIRLTKEADNLDDTMNIINFPRVSNDFLQNLKEFLNVALKTPHLYFKNYISNFMIVCDSDERFMHFGEKILLAYFEPQGKLSVTYYGNHYSLNDIYGNFGNCIKKSDVTCEPPKEVNHNINNKRWKRIEDTAAYRGCPIGILPKLGYRSPIGL